MRWLVVLILLLLVAWKFWPEPEPIPVEETFIGPQIKALKKAQGVEQQYLDATDERKREMEEQLEKESGG